MPDEPPVRLSREHITQLLASWPEHDSAGREALVSLVYDELHRLAHHYMSSERPGHTLQTTALVNEVFVRLIDGKQVQWRNRAHFFAIVSQAMRRILIDYAKQRNRGKRGGGNEAIELNDEVLAAVDQTNVDFIALDAALRRLGEFDPQQEKIVELRYFGGLNMDEIAKIMGIHRATAARDWQMAKTWLYRELTR